jgi:hypothetical protein
VLTPGVATPTVRPDAAPDDGRPIDDAGLIDFPTIDDAAS